LVYQEFYQPKEDLLNALSMRFLTLINEVSIDYLANLLNCFAGLNYINYLAIDIIEKRILKILHKIHPLVNDSA